MVEHFLLTYGYLALVIGEIFEGEATLIMAGFLANLGYFKLSLVIIITIIVGYLTDLILYLGGYHYGSHLMERLPFLKRHYPKTERFIAQYGAISLFVTRYIYGIRMGFAFLCGMARMHKWLYLGINLVSIVIRAIVISSLGYLFGHTITSVLGNAKRFEREFLTILILTAGIIWIWHRVQKQRNATDLLKNKP